MNTKHLGPGSLTGLIHMYVGDVAFVKYGKSDKRQSIWFSKEGKNKPEMFATLFKHPGAKQPVLLIEPGYCVTQETIEETILPAMREFDAHIAKYYKKGDVVIVCPVGGDAKKCPVCTRFKAAHRLWKTIKKAQS